MPDYGDAPYWDERYEKDEVPFDWLFDLKELLPIIHTLIPDRESPILIVGAGNANFSPDLQTYGGYTNIVNIDISPVVIEQQRLRYPQQRWLVMDITDMSEFQDHSFPYIIDKSLIDTLLCSSNSSYKIVQMLDEMYRVLNPGGRILTFSLHGIEKNTMIYQNQKFASLWRTFRCAIRSNRWDEHENSRKSVAHTMIVCDKPRNFLRNFEVYSELHLNLTELHEYLQANQPELLDEVEKVTAEKMKRDEEEIVEEDDIDYLRIKYQNVKGDKARLVTFLNEHRLLPYYQLPYKNMLSLPGVLSPEEHQALKKHAEAINFRYSVLDSSTQKIAKALFKATQKISEERSEDTDI